MNYNSFLLTYKLEIGIDWHWFKYDMSKIVSTWEKRLSDLSHQENVGCKPWGLEFNCPLVQHTLLIQWGEMKTHRKRQMTKRFKGPNWPNLSMTFWNFHTLFQINYCIFFFFSCWFWKEKKNHLTVDRNEGFNFTTLPFNRNLLFTFWIFQYNHIILCLLLKCSFQFRNWYYIFNFLTWSSFFETISSTFSPLVAFWLILIFGGIWDPLTSYFASRNNWKLLKFLFTNEGSCKSNYSSLHVIQGELWLHNWVSEPLPFYNKLGIQKKKKKYLKKTLIKYLLQTRILASSKNLEL